MRSLLITIAIFLLFVLNNSHKSYAQFSEETGFFPIVNFSQEDYGNALPQNWDIIQDKRGIMYFANNEGVLEYDGIRWNLYSVNNETPVHSLATDNNGRIYVGAINEFGFLSPNKYGHLEYISLVKYLDDSLRNFKEVWYIHPTQKGVYFQTYEYLFYWDGNKMSYWKPKDDFFHTSFYINNRLIINFEETGLHVLKDNKFIKIRNSEVFDDKSIFSVIPYRNNYLAATKSDGFFKVSFNKDMDKISVLPFGNNLKQVLKNYKIINAIKINENTYSIGTWGSGLLIFQDGNIVKLITRESGINNEVINKQYLDKDNNLWLALSEGITKIEINSPITRFDEKLGIEGRIESIARYNDKIYLATEKGLLYLPNMWSRPEKIYEQNKFKKIQKFQGGCWDVFNYTNNKESYLLVAVDDGIIQIDKHSQIKNICKCYPWKLYQSKYYNNLIYIGLDDGLATLKRENGKWIFNREFPKINEKVYNLTEDNDGNLWLGTMGMGIIKIDNTSLSGTQDPKIERFNSQNGLPENCDIFIANYKNHLFFGTDKGIYERIEGTDSFSVSKSLPKKLTNDNRIITRMIPDKNGKLWIVCFLKAERIIEVGYITENKGKYNWIDTPFNTISQGDIHAVHIDDDSIVWFGGSKGLYRYDPTVHKNYKKDFASVIRLNIISEDSTIFFGSYFDENGYVTTIQPEVLKPHLKYKYNSLEFEFSAQNPEIEHPVLFNYIMEGYDKKWSDWSEKGFERYTNLHEGTYIFRVKAKDIYEYQSKEASYEFVIKPPWYRTWVAYISYVLILIALVYIIVTQYTKYLRGVIKLKTKEIRRQKEIVEHKNEEIMDSIKYAERIQKALLPPKEILEKTETEHFILFKPRDIVSGDFYWFREIKDFVVIAAADCTGHGVPGAFVSMLGMAFLNEISVEIREVKANEILNKLRALIIKSLRQTGKEGESKDGMDIALYVIDKKNMRLQFSGANNPLVIIRNGEIIQIKGDRMPIGFHIIMDEFQNNEIEIEKGDMLYTFSDGYQDQFGGEKGSKFMIKKMKRLMVEKCELPVDEQHKFFDDTIEEWKKEGNEEQVDDILLIGVRI